MAATKTAAPAPPITAAGAVGTMLVATETALAEVIRLRAEVGNLGTIQALILEKLDGIPKRPVAPEAPEEAGPAPSTPRELANIKSEMDDLSCLVCGVVGGLYALATSSEMEEKAGALAHLLLDTLQGVENRIDDVVARLSALTREQREGGA